MLAIALVAVLACQAAPPSPAATPPARQPQSGGGLPGSQAAAPTTAAATTTPSVADLFRERNAREAAARAAAESPAAPADGQYRCRRTATSVTCGTDEETMRRTEEEAKAQLDRLFSPH